MKNQAFTTFEKTTSKPRTRLYDGYRKMNKTDLYQQVVGFTCMVCKQEVSSNPIYSGVGNRNHCPYCLSSRHVDLFQSGDRLNACKGDMLPIGLAWKKITKKYGTSHGELMIIHRCRCCHQFSINRIAADDRSDLIERLFRETVNYSNEFTILLSKEGIQPVRLEQEQELLACLFGSS